MAIVNNPTNSWKKISAIEFILLRQERGAGKYYKQKPRDPEERILLKDLALQKMEKADRNNFFLLDYRHRRVHSG